MQKRNNGSTRKMNWCVPLKASVSQIVDAYSKTVLLCMDQIKKVNELHKAESEESKAYQTKKIIDKWFANGGIVRHPL